MDKHTNNASTATNERTKPVQVRLRHETLERIEDLRALTGKSKTQVIVDAVNLFHRLATTFQEGGRLTLEEKDGRCVQLEFVGL